MLKKHYDSCIQAEPAQIGATLFETTPTHNPEDTADSPPDSPAARTAGETTGENLSGSTGPAATGLARPQYRHFTCGVPSFGALRLYL